MQRTATDPDKRSPGIGTPIVLGCTVLMAVVLMLDWAFPRGVAIDALYIVPVLLSLRMQRTSSIIATAAACSVLIVLGFFISAPGADLWKSVFNRFISVAALWICVLLGIRYQVMVAKREKAVREREKALEEIKILSGLLPICAWCKKVRDDDGYWTQIETYISSHSQASFSHGICPECRQKQLSDLAAVHPEPPKKESR
jgi:K+-sensing histidine kinase KdpD